MTRTCKSCGTDHSDSLGRSIIVSHTLKAATDEADRRMDDAVRRGSEYESEHWYHVVNGLEELSHRQYPSRDCRVLFEGAPLPPEPEVETVRRGWPWQAAQ